MSVDPSTGQQRTSIVHLDTSRPASVIYDRNGDQVIVPVQYPGHVPFTGVPVPNSSSRRSSRIRTLDGNNPTDLHMSEPQYGGFGDEQDSEGTTAVVTPPGKILLLQTLTTLSTIVFTVLPVMVKGGGDESWGQWYTWKDAVRLIEPFVSGVLHFWFFFASDLMRPAWSSSAQLLFHQQQRQHQQHQGHAREGTTGSLIGLLSGSNSEGPMSIPLKDLPDFRKDGHNSAPSSTSAPGQSTRPRHLGVQSSAWFKTTLATIFTFFLIVYCTGAAIHTAAALFKNTISLFLDQHSQGIGLSTHPLTNGTGPLMSMELAQKLKQGYLLMQDEWEHTISHYMYAVGALGMSWCEMVAYSGQILPRGLNLARVGHLKKGVAVTFVPTTRESSSKRLVLLWILAGVLYGGIVAGVACQYPKGLYVGIGYVLALLIFISVYILSTPGPGLFTLGRHYILQTYLIAAVVAAVGMVIYMAINQFDMLTSNDKSHLSSVTRP